MRAAVLILAFGLAGCLPRGEAPKAGGGPARTGTGTGTGTGTEPGGGGGGADDLTGILFLEPPQSPFLSGADFQVTRAAELTTQDLHSEIDTNASFEAAPRRTEESGPSVAANPHSCLSRALGAIKVKGQLGRLVWAYDVDVRGCEQRRMDDEARQGGAPGTVEIATYRFYAEMLCDGVDLTRFNGRTARELGKAGEPDPCWGSGGTRSRLVVNLSTRFKFKYRSEAGGEAEIDARFANLNGGRDGGYCERRRDGQTISVDRCRAATIATDLDGDQVLNDLVAEGLTYEEGDRFYRAGVYKMAINGWTGEMVYSSATRAPRWTLKNGAETLSGTWGEAATGASLRFEPRLRALKAGAYPDMTR